MDSKIILLQSDGLCYNFSKNKRTRKWTVKIFYCKMLDFVTSYMSNLSDKQSKRKNCVDSKSILLQNCWVHMGIDEQCCCVMSTFQKLKVFVEKYVCRRHWIFKVVNKVLTSQLQLVLHMFKMFYEFQMLSVNRIGTTNISNCLFCFSQAKILLPLNEHYFEGRYVK